MAKSHIHVMVLAVFVMPVGIAAASSLEVHPAHGFGMLQAGEVVDAGEFYRTTERKIRLFRSLDKVVVRGADVAAVATRIDAAAQTPFHLELADHAHGLFVFRAAERLKCESLSAVVGVVGADAVYINEESGREMLVTDRFVVRLNKGVPRAVLEAFNLAHGVVIVSRMHGTDREYVCRKPVASSADVLALCEVYHDNTLITWAGPDFVFKPSFHYTPSDPFFADQWHLDNIGQTGALIDADVDAAEAWDRADTPQGGSPDVVIAVIDSGVDLDHEDLAANIFVNAIEAAGDPGVDDDGNGYVDDINGWDFYDNDNTPDPTVAGEPNPVAHGTCVAGVAAAVEGNGAGGVGVAFSCKILPVKLSADAGDFASSTSIGNAIRYAADMANVLNGSWGIDDDAVVHSAIQYAVNTKGRPVFFATGNAAAGGFGPCWTKETLSVDVGTHYIEWGYTSGWMSMGEDTLWIDDIVFPDESTESFEDGSLPAGWTTGGASNWTINSESKRSRGTGCYSAESGPVGSSQTSWLRTSQMTFSAGDLTFYRWVDCGYCALGAHGYVTIEGSSPVEFGDPCPVQFDVGFPAQYSECIAVGASTDFDYRSPYSACDETLTNVLDIVASSDAGNGFIITTDIASEQGYDDGDYLMKFGGTSASTPLAAGVAALMLSKNPDLTAGQVQTILEDTADKIGCQAYDGQGYNKYYGYGRINADAALEATPGGQTDFFDFDQDGDVDLEDFGEFIQCFDGPVNLPPGGCSVNADYDSDGNVDLFDFAAFQEAFTG
ncbi:MAG: S8 family serine peptidase [Phycisphaerae bacterium]|nr:S8 family serine peptidase [Phycisphaerae bacterium]